MRVSTVGKFVSVCEPNHGRAYDGHGRLIAKAWSGDRRINKKRHARTLRREGQRIGNNFLGEVRMKNAAINKLMSYILREIGIKL